MKKVICVLTTIFLVLGSTAQTYHPEGHAFVCVNGENRYTRALYGSPTEWRVETSDCPVFAIYKKKDCRNIQFYINGINLDAIDYCEARYEDGMRSYILRHKTWGKDAELRLKVVASLQSEQAFWRFQAIGFAGRVNLRAISSNIRKQKLSRNGDIGADPKDAFEADGQEPLQQLETQYEKECYVCCNGITISLKDTKEDFLKAESAMQQLAGRIVFNTPDPYINTLGGAIVMAADGDWDGQTWLHGCIGWRMPLAGWRAGYMGDVLGWNDRAVSHFDAYAKSQVKNVPAVKPHPTQDVKQHLARAEKQWGTQMYSNGYICRNPNRNDQMHHYDMNLNYMDELLWHFQYDADTIYMRRMWPVIQSHLAWEKRNYDPDGDNLCDAYCCIWASDALYYSGGAVTHSSAYNYRGNRLAARIAEILGEDSQPYREEAEAILTAMNERLWLPKKGVWAEYQDAMGLKRKHEHPAVWSIYTPIDCGACSLHQAYAATRYVDEHIPHIDVEDTGYQTIATSDWLPYSWSINNVAAAEVMHTALALFEAGRPEQAFRLMKGNILDQMYYGQSPANFGQISQYDAARGECYRDFGDCIGISARALLQGLFGVIPQALDNQCIIRPGFPSEWDSVSLRTPYIDYKYTCKNGKERYEITQHFSRPLKIVLRKNLPYGNYRDIEGTAEIFQVIEVEKESLPLDSVTSVDSSKKQSAIGMEEPDLTKKFRPQTIGRFFNANVDNIFKNQYLSPRPSVTTLQIPVQGVGEWCHPQYTPIISDSVFRTLINNGEFVVAGVPFKTPEKGYNIVYTSLWDNYPDSVVIPMKGEASRAWLLMAGSTNHMQSRINNGLVVMTYRDGTSDTMALYNPDTWCPIEQDYYVDGKAFQVAQPRPYRVCLGTGTVSRNLGKALDIEGVYGREIPGGAATMLCLPLKREKRLKSLTLRTLSNDVVIGLMGVTLQ